MKNSISFYLGSVEHNIVCDCGNSVLFNFSINLEFLSGSTSAHHGGNPADDQRAHWEPFFYAEETLDHSLLTCRANDRLDFHDLAPAIGRLALRKLVDNEISSFFMKDGIYDPNGLLDLQGHSEKKYVDTYYPNLV